MHRQCDSCASTFIVCVAILSTCWYCGCNERPFKACRNIICGGHGLFCSHKLLLNIVKINKIMYLIVTLIVKDGA